MRGLRSLALLCVCAACGEASDDATVTGGTGGAGGSAVGDATTGGTPTGGTPIGGTPTGGTPTGGTPTGGTPTGGAGGEPSLPDAGAPDAGSVDPPPGSALPALASPAPEPECAALPDALDGALADGDARWQVLVPLGDQDTGPIAGEAESRLDTRLRFTAPESGLWAFQLGWSEAAPPPAGLVLALDRTCRGPGQLHDLAFFAAGTLEGAVEEMTAGESVTVFIGGAPAPVDVPLIIRRVRQGATDEACGLDARCGAGLICNAAAACAAGEAPAATNGRAVRESGTDNLLLEVDGSPGDAPAVEAELHITTPWGDRQIREHLPVVVEGGVARLAGVFTDLAYEDGVTLEVAFRGLGGPRGPLAALPVEPATVAAEGEACDPAGAVRCPEGERCVAADGAPAACAAAPAVCPDDGTTVALAPRPDGTYAAAAGPSREQALPVCLAAASPSSVRVHAYGFTAPSTGVWKLTATTPIVARRGCGWAGASARESIGCATSLSVSLVAGEHLEVLAAEAFAPGAGLVAEPLAVHHFVDLAAFLDETTAEVSLRGELRDAAGNLVRPGNIDVQGLDDAGRTLTVRGADFGNASAGPDPLYLQATQVRVRASVVGSRADATAVVPLQSARTLPVGAACNWGDPRSRCVDGAECRLPAEVCAATPVLPLDRVHATLRRADGRVELTWSERGQSRNVEVRGRDAAGRVFTIGGNAGVDGQVAVHLSDTVFRLVSLEYTPEPGVNDAAGWFPLPFDEAPPLARGEPCTDFGANGACALEDLCDYASGRCVARRGPVVSNLVVASDDRGRLMVDFDLEWFIEAGISFIVYARDEERARAVIIGGRNFPSIPPGTRHVSERFNVPLEAEGLPEIGVFANDDGHSVRGPETSVVP